MRSASDVPDLWAITISTSHNVQGGAETGVHTTLERAVTKENAARAVLEKVAAQLQPGWTISSNIAALAVPFGVAAAWVDEVCKVRETMR